MKPIRSLLFAPAIRPELVAKAMKSVADAVIIDLEDSVPLDQKVTAREVLSGLAPGAMPVYVRVNGPETPYYWDDVVASVRPGVSGLIIPKTERGATLVALDGALTALEAAAGVERGSIEVIALIESALGVINAFEILSQPRIASVFLGTAEEGDLVADLGCHWTPDGVGLQGSRSLVLAAARAAGIHTPIDGAFMNLDDLDALRRECELAQTVGYQAKVALHPKQVPVIHEVFAVDASEVERQRRILEAFDHAVSEGKAAIRFEGKMVDYATARVARLIVARAEWAAEMEARQR
jgi:citrate lyase subunit beta/citryl-CoA lyase